MCKHLNDRGVEFIMQALEEIQFGSLLITIHDSKITQVDKTVKSRFPLESRTTSVKTAPSLSNKK
ncbi:YezD family protein [Aneurinibacillus sp. Ricciae_BoGa-3]|uniref:YezD family protein n=1 Tax=Aneurinibacillus sp. Ricciae_BoGa-3 TaxID=3022697 RepID=UPI002341AEEA|nr:YezD family protein [Aneurinibacillus sp. Ricciae_BoGa-3]WCK54068.1 YezD family protein [Aneurinibacillus sp. Ricciae_BoGa-3]